MKECGTRCGRYFRARGTGLLPFFRRADNMRECGTRCGRYFRAESAMCGVREACLHMSAQLHL